MGKLNETRIETIFTITAAAGVGGFATFAPTPTLEVPKQVVLGAADIAMCCAIWKFYFKEEMAEKSMIQTLGTTGLIAAVAFGAGWIVAKGATGILHEFANAIPGIGWVSSGVVAASATATLGLAFMWYCDTRYRNMYPVKEKSSLDELKRFAVACKTLLQTLMDNLKGRKRGIA